MIADKARYTPDSGYMERTLTMALSPMEIDEEDCGTTDYLKTIVFSEKHAKILTGKWYLDENDQTLKILDFETAKTYINRYIYIRSPMTCKTPCFRICKKCFGSRIYPTRYVGITAGQILAERLTQLIMRTFKWSA
jgi:DNA-directed RNA polymerase subunit beta'